MCFWFHLLLQMHRITHSALPAARKRVQTMFPPQMILCVCVCVCLPSMFTFLHSLRGCRFFLSSPTNILVQIVLCLLVGTTTCPPPQPSRFNQFILYSCFGPVLVFCLGFSGEIFWRSAVTLYGNSKISTALLILSQTNWKYVFLFH